MLERCLVSTTARARKNERPPALKNVSVAPHAYTSGVKNHFWDRCHAPSDGTQSVAYGDGWTIEISEVAAAFGREGGSLQVLVQNNQGINMSIQNMDEGDAAVTDAFAPSGELADWALRAGYVAERYGAEGEFVFHNAGWDTAFYVRPISGSSLRISKAARGDREDYLVDVSDARTGEAFFIMQFGPSVRSALRLPRLRMPTSKGKVYEGYKIDDGDPGHLALLTVDDIAVGSIKRLWDPVSDVAMLVKVSWALGTSASALIESFTSPRGEPLFELR